MARQPYRTVHTSDIVAHLFYAACDTTSVVVTTSDGDFGGVLLEPSRAEVAVEVHGRAPELARGTSVCVAYVGSDDQYRFYTEVLSFDGGQLRMALPFAVEHTDRRAVPRFVTPASEGYGVRLAGVSGPPLSVQNVSTAGLSFYGRDELDLELGSYVEGELIIPGEEPFPVQLEVRQLGARRGQSLIGARIDEISLRHRARLAWLLATRAGLAAA